MTQELLDELKQNWEAVREHENAVKSLNQRSQDIRNACDHKNADNTSAVRAEWLHDVCQICSQMW